MVGFTISDKTMGILGKIEDIFETPGQVLATLHFKEKEVLVPLVEATIIKVDGATQTIYVDLPARPAGCVLASAGLNFPR